MLATKKCPYCAEDIQVEAIKCKHCKMDLVAPAMRPAVQSIPRPPVMQVNVTPRGGGFGRFLKNAIMLCMLIIFGGIAGTCVLCGKAVHDTATASKRSHEEARAAVTEARDVVDVSADQLQSDYAKNEVSADGLYRGKVLRVTGAVQSIKKDFSDEPYMQIWTRNEFMPVLAHFDAAGGLASVSVSDHITVRCVGDNVILGSPILRSCVIE